jgi:VanZ family protein
MKSKNLHMRHSRTYGSSLWRAWLPAVVWAGTIFAASSLPGSTYPPVKLPAADKVVHVAIFAVLGALCARGARGSGGWMAARALWVGSTLATLYGVTDEVHQMFVPRRSPDWRDVLADAIGAFIGAALFVRLRAMVDGPRRGGPR